MGCDFRLGNKGGLSGPKTVFVYTHDEVMAGTVKIGRDPFKYVIRGILNESKGHFPCFGFDPADDTTSWITGAGEAIASGAVMSATDMDSGEIVSEDIPPEHTETPIEGLLDSTQPADLVYEELIADIGKGGEMATFMACPLRANGVDALREHVKARIVMGNPGLKGTINTIGVPEEEMGAICELHGAGFINDGPYAIERIVHSWSPGSWDMQLGVHRRGYKTNVGEKKESRGGQMSK
jgi:hypothetical protein